MNQIRAYRFRRETSPLRAQKLTVRTVYVPFGSWFKDGRDSEDGRICERLA